MKSIVNAGIKCGNARGSIICIGQTIARQRRMMTSPSMKHVPSLRRQQIWERTRGAAELLSLHTTGLDAQEWATQTVWSGLAGVASPTCEPGGRRCPWMPWPTTIAAAARDRTFAAPRRPPRCWRPSGGAAGSKCVSAKELRTSSRKASRETRSCLHNRRHTSRLWSCLLLLMRLWTH